MHQTKYFVLFVSALPYPKVSMDELSLICDFPLKLPAVSSAMNFQMLFITGHLRPANHVGFPLSYTSENSLLTLLLATDATD